MTRQEFVLAVLAAGDGEEHSLVQAQKLLFLLDRTVAKRVGGPWFDFQPGAFGPIAEGVLEDLRALAEKGLVVIAEPPNGAPAYRATYRGVLAGQQLLGQLPEETADYIRWLSAWVRQQSFGSLVSAVRQLYPEMGVNSVFREAQ